MSYSATGLAAALTGVTDAGRFLSLHIADPRITGAGEAAGLVRQAAEWDIPTGGDVDSTEVDFRVPPEADGSPPRLFGHFGVWTAATGGEFVCGGELGEVEQFSRAGGHYLLTATLTAASAD